jgi:hypothetical protein
VQAHGVYREPDANRRREVGHTVNHREIFMKILIPGGFYAENS